MAKDEKDRLREELIKLLDDFVVIANKYPKLKHTFRYAIGAIYALSLSIELGHKSRKNYTRIDESYVLEEIKKVSENIKNNKKPPKSWRAGFFCNNAFMRVAAINERFLKAIKESIRGVVINPRKQRGENELQFLARVIKEKSQNCGRNLEINIASFDKVRIVVNNIKHKIEGQTIEDANVLQEDDHTIIINSLKHLVGFFKREDIQQLLTEMYGSD